jgi:hypothetical protein
VGQKAGAIAAQTKHGWQEQEWNHAGTGGNHHQNQLPPVQATDGTSPRTNGSAHDEQL